MTFKARLDHTCMPRSKAAARQYDAEEIVLYVDLPFVPAIGTMLKPTTEDDFLTVSDVLLDLSPGGEGLVLGLEAPSESNGARLEPWAEMKKRGWKLASVDFIEKQGAKT